MSEWRSKSRCSRSTRRATATSCSPNSSTSSAIASKGLGYEKLDQLTMEVLLGVR